MEGPGVKVIAEILNPILKGKIIKNAWGHSRRIDYEKVKNREITDVFSHGKNLLIKLKRIGLIKIHFLMYGSYSIDEITKEERRIMLALECDRKVYFYNCSASLIKRFKPLVQDILDPKWDLEKALKKLKKAKGYICDILLDQNILPGVGNIIKVEGLYAAKIHPASLVEKVDENRLRDLLEAIRQFSLVFYKARKEHLRLFNFTMAYGKNKCLACRNKIKIKRFGKLRRISYFCMRCQKLYH